VAILHWVHHDAEARRDSVVGARWVAPNLVNDASAVLALAETQQRARSQAADAVCNRGPALDRDE